MPRWELAYQFGLCQSHVLLDILIILQFIIEVTGKLALLAFL